MDGARAIAATPIVTGDLFRTAYWEPFPIYWPHFYHRRIHWNRIPWIVRF